MRKSLMSVVLLLGGMLLGGTVFRDQVAGAAAAVLQVKVVNTTAEPVPVQQQGAANVNVTNTRLTVAPPAAVTSGGQRSQVDAGQTASFGSALTASALVVQFRNGASEILFLLDGRFVARFPGPGPLVLGLNQPISFDSLRCGGADGSSCDVGWAGSAA